MSIREKASQQVAARNYSFTVVFEAVGSGRGPSGNGSRNGRGNRLEASGYQVTVPLLPGLITRGRTLAEAREMARDAIRFHLDGLRKDGGRIPDEKTRFRKASSSTQRLMSPRVPILKPREVLRALQKAGFEIHHQSGSHAQIEASRETNCG